MIHSNHAVALAVVALNAASVMAFPMDNDHAKRTVPSQPGSSAWPTTANTSSTGPGAPHNMTMLSALPTTAASSVGTVTTHSKPTLSAASSPVTTLPASGTPSMHMPTTTVRGLAIATPCAIGQPPTLELFHSPSLLPSTMSHEYANRTTSSGAPDGGHLNRVMPRAVASSGAVVPSSTTATSLTSSMPQATSAGPPSTDTTGSAAPSTFASPLPRPSSTNTTTTGWSSTQSTATSPTPPPSTRLPFPQDTLPGAPGPPKSVMTTVALSETTRLNSSGREAQGTPTPPASKRINDVASAPTVPTATTQTHTGVDGKSTVIVFIPSTATYCYGTHPEGTGTPTSQGGSGGRAVPSHGTASHMPPSRAMGGPPDPRMVARATESSKRESALDQLD